jgi:hypothetical protein
MKNLKLILLALIFWIFVIWNFSFAGNPFVRNLLWTQLEIWLNQRSNYWTFRHWQEWDTLSIQQEIFYQNQYNLVAELDKCKSEQDRLSILNQYIASLTNTISHWTTLYNYEKSQIDYYNNEVQKCTTPIKWKNSEFSDAVKNYNYEKAESIAQEIAELRACIAKNEVYIKAHASYASSSKWLNTLQKKADYLSQNKEKIAKYYEILKPDLLKELYDISKTVENNF